MIMDNYQYQIHYQDPSKTRWRCRMHQKNLCRAILYTTGNCVMIHNGHNHAPVDNIPYDHLKMQVVKIIDKRRPWRR
ncbi:unnamed protein product [Acanthoscelides obtectus]|uniref:FLYWCH-type domain-containing protein n=1 Tax=Acanthoscelides obtectus TaxID=200917 RepID=A0A9P0L789_ACAOB|nr:unnamed protein product [Acanthoscelides obtectus]CAK1676622.1 hypothetical protein AOBTE_LOCUS30864 [Acanthoscelides obtectus]